MANEIEIIDRRPQWTEWNGKGVPPIKVGQTVERRYRDGEEQSIKVREYHIASFMWEHRGNQDDITAYRVVCGVNGEPL